jgi:hypothetical protein
LAHSFSGQERPKGTGQKEMNVTQYLLAVHGVEGEEPPAPEVIEVMYRDVDAFNHKMMDQGVWVFGGGLHEPSTATVVRVEDGQVVMTDGPFIEAKEHLGGFWVIEAPDLDAALAWAAEARVACQGAVEVRPFQDE